MDILFIMSSLLTVFYVGLMFTYRKEWNRLKETDEAAESVSTFISVIIPARNEASNILNILSDIAGQNYPKELFETIVIDDNSEDDTFEISSQFAAKSSQLEVFKLQDLLAEKETISAYKKRAIEAAVQLAKGRLIVTTDADCRMGKDWLRSIATLYEKENCKLIASPVCFHNDITFFEKFQALDFCGMQAITAASLGLKIFNMANGANLAYEKEAFLSVNGYQHIDDKASGDDMLLIYKIAQQFPNSVSFLKNKKAVVYTEPSRNLREFLQQRFRWTSKSASYQDIRITLILGLVYLFVLSIWVNIFFSIEQLTVHLRIPSGLLSLVLIQMVAKSITDYFFLESASSFFGRKDLMKTFFTSELWHTWYIPFVGTFGNILPYNWKGRKLK